MPNKFCQEIHTIKIVTKYLGRQIKSVTIILKGCIEKVNKNEKKAKQRSTTEATEFETSSF
jgi:hypothetical protein